MVPGEEVNTSGIFLVADSDYGLSSALPCYIVSALNMIVLPVMVQIQ